MAGLVSAPRTAIVIAAGQATRWDDYRGTPKHLVEVDGEPILHRTVRLLRRHIDTVWVVGPNDPRYHHHDGRTYTVTPGPSDADKFYSSRDLWDGHTLIVYGDCYFTEDAIDTICAPVQDWTLYCRPHGSAITGSRWGECFAYSLPAHTLDTFRSTLVWLAGMHELQEIGRCGGWELYRALCGEDLHNHVMYDHHIVIDDWSEDFDYPADYELWCHRRDTA